MDDRALIFANLLNGVPSAQVARDFHKRSEDEVMQIFLFVLRKIKSYCFERARGYTDRNDPEKNARAYPIIAAHDVKTAQAYRLTCLSVLPKLNLDKSPRYKDIQTEIVNPDNVMAIARNLSA